MSGKKEKTALAICRARKMELVLTDKTMHLCVRRALSVVFVVVDEKWCLQFLTREIWILTSLCQSLPIRGSIFTAKLKIINFIQCVWIREIWIVQNSCNVVFILHNDRGGFSKACNMSRSNCSTNNLWLMNLPWLQIAHGQDSILLEFLWQLPKLLGRHVMGIMTLPFCLEK